MSKESDVVWSHTGKSLSLREMGPSYYIMIEDNYIFMSVPRPAKVPNIWFRFWLKLFFGLKIVIPKELL